MFPHIAAIVLLASSLLSGAVAEPIPGLTPPPAVVKPQPITVPKPPPAVVKPQDLGGSRKTLGERSCPGVENIWH